MYITKNWPIRYATISPSVNFLAIAGRRGLAHYSTESKRWKLFGNEQQEQSFVVRGGMLWHRYILFVACQDFMTSDPNCDSFHEMQTWTHLQCFTSSRCPASRSQWTA
ncbi:hypothetical protein BJ742DRAFT_369738 [Cladochytrium replicatum]|nr:hypothetical protein BJ742DRAFT_369738 [Cladochytrium replicatum]